MQATKQKVRELLNRLPDDCSVEDVLYHLYVIQKVDAGMADAEAGRLIPHELSFRRCAASGWRAASRSLDTDCP